MALALVYSAVAGPAYAYIDPGTGTLLLQLLIAAIATGLATVKLWYYKVVSLFRPTPPEAESEEAKSEDS
ncbi:MAG: hypothetical protein KI792_09795 [Alphaproteobacteria bacterium]|nr:hypothetical protein [Alphaproteobacteria bacterium SS10]